jgi:hypothetical protein
MLFFCSSPEVSFFNNIMNLTQNVIKSINWHFRVYKKFRWVPPECTKEVVVLSKLIPLYETWTNSHTVIIYKVTSFKITIFYWQQTASEFRKRHDGNWCCVFETILCSARNAVCVCARSAPCRSHAYYYPPDPRLCTCGYTLMGLRIQFPPEACMSISFALSCRGLCFWLITRSEQSYRLCYVRVWSWSLDNDEALAH